MNEPAFPSDKILTDGEGANICVSNNYGGLSKLEYAAIKICAEYGAHNGIAHDNDVEMARSVAAISQAKSLLSALEDEK